MKLTHGEQEARRIWGVMLVTKEAYKKGMTLCREQGISKKATESGLVIAMNDLHLANQEIKQARKIFNS